MTIAFTLWLNQLFSSSSGTVRPPASVDRKPMEIEVECLPDYLWRDLGFQQPKHPE